MEYRLANGSVITDEDIERECLHTVHSLPDLRLHMKLLQQKLYSISLYLFIINDQYPNHSQPHFRNICFCPSLVYHTLSRNPNTNFLIIS